MPVGQLGNYPSAGAQQACPAGEVLVVVAPAWVDTASC